MLDGRAKLQFLLDNRKISYKNIQIQFQDKDHLYYNHDRRKLVNLPDPHQCPRNAQTWLNLIYVNSAKRSVSI